MVLLLITTFVGMLLTLGLPIAAGFWLKKRLGVTWRVIMYGALGYFLVQSLIVLAFRGYQTLVEGGTLNLTASTGAVMEFLLNVVLAALAGVLIRWAGMKYLNEKLDLLEDALGLGLGYGGVEIILLVGLRILVTFINMIIYFNVDPTTANLAPEILDQVIEMQQLPAYLPLVVSLESLSALVMHIAVTILVLQVFLRGKKLYLAAAFGVEVLINGVIWALLRAGIQYGWVVVVSILLMLGNLYLLYRLDAHKVDFERTKRQAAAAEAALAKAEIEQQQEDNDEDQEEA